MLIDRVNESGWKVTNMRATNITGTPLDISSMDGDIEYMDATIIPDEYTITASNLVGTTIDLLVTAASGDANPWHNRSVLAFDFGFDTWSYDTIPGLNLYIDPSIADGDEGLIKIGEYGGTMSSGGVTAGVPSAEVRHQVENSGTEDVTECAAKLLTQVINVPMDNFGFGAFIVVRPFAEDAVEKNDPITGQALAYKLSISGVTGAGALKVATLSVDGVVLEAASVFDITASTYGSGVGLKAISYATPYPYRIVTGPLTGMEFVIWETVANGDYSNILVFENVHVEIAPDSAGTAGEWGTADVPLTEVGEIDGTITPGGFAYYWSRFVIEEGSGGQSNPYPCSIALFGNEDEPGSADWES